MIKGNSASLGSRLRRLRKGNGWTLADLSRMTGLAPSTLSKVENDQMSLTYDNLIKLADGIGIDIANLFHADEGPQATGRRSITRRGEGLTVETPNYDYEYVCTDLARKQMIPMVVRLKAHSMTEFGELLRHGGEELIYVLEGAIEVHTEFYQPVTLEAGDCIYLDSTMAHGYLAAGKANALVLGVCSGRDTAPDGTFIPHNQPEPDSSPAREIKAKRKRA